MVDREQDVTYLIKPHKFSSTTATEVCHKYITHDLKSLETQFRTKCDNAFRCVKLAFNLNLTRLLYRIEYHSTVREAHLWAWWRYIYYNSSPVNLLSCQHPHYIFPLSIKSVVPQYFQYQFSPTIYVHWLFEACTAAGYMYTPPERPQRLGVQNWLYLRENAAAS